MAAALGSGILPRLSELATGSATIEANGAEESRIQRLAALMLTRAVLQGDSIVRAAVIAFDGINAIERALGGSRDEHRMVQQAIKALRSTT